MNTVLLVAPFVKGIKTGITKNSTKGNNGGGYTLNRNFEGNSTLKDAGVSDAAGKEVILDTNAVFRLKEAQQLLKPGEVPVITRTTMAELRNLKAQGRMGIPKYIDDIKIIDDVGSANTRINVRGKMYEIAELQKSKVKGNMFADGSIGATALETGNPIITFDKLFKKALQNMGGDVR